MANPYFENLKHLQTPGNLLLIAPSESQLLLVSYHFVLYQFQNKRDTFSWVSPTYVQFYTHIVVLFKRAYSTADVFNSSQKLFPHEQQQPNSQHPSHHQATEFNYL